MKIAPDDLATWETVMRCLDQALDLAAEERQPWLEQLAKQQAELAEMVRELLSERDTLIATGFLDLPSLRTTTSATQLPTLQKLLRARIGVAGNAPQLKTGLAAGVVVGAYRLIHEIGHGGMSSVWLAERCDGQPKRQVALKLPFTGPARQLLADRFSRECDILATLTHPNIARLYDAGLTTAGEPYLAMEYVEGHDIARYCDDNLLTVRQRLRLFLDALEAVEFAHEHLILHRDLKPSNILVTKQGRVVLLDFGIAKVLSDDAAGSEPPTEVLGRILTPHYASPEHICGKPLSTASDVYSLGVLLYELLTGSRPFCSPQRSRRELEEAILSQEPAQLSRAAITDDVAAARDTTTRKLLHDFKGDLDTILRKALKKDPIERYRTVDAFGQDIANHLANLPVSARPDSPWYRIHRFVSRHRLPAIAASITLLAIVGGSVAAVSQARMAARERDRAYALASRNETISDFTKTLITDAAASAQPMTVNDMLTRSENIALGDTSINREDRAAILGMIADQFDSLGNIGKAASLLERALQLMEGSRDVELSSQLTCTHALVLVELGQTDTANKEFARELDGLRARPGIDAISCLFFRARVAQRLGDADAVLQYGAAALEQYRSLRHHTTVENEGIFLSAIAGGYLLKGQVEQANQYYALALKTYVDSGRENNPNAVAMQLNWANVNLSSGTPRRALEIYDRLLTFRSSGDPARRQATMVYNRARTLQDLGRYQEARDAYASAIDLGLQQHNLMARVFSLLGLATLAEQSEQLTAAADYLRQAIELAGSSFPEKSLPFLKLAEVRGRMALVDGNLDEARKYFELVVGNKSKGTPTVYGELDLAELELASNNPAAAENDARTALNVATSLQGVAPHSNLSGLSWLMLGRALQSRGDVDNARLAFASAVDNLSNTVDAAHLALIDARKMLGTR
jgi:serine/threonine protein kinase